jgi:5'-nucleotidase
VVISGHTNGAYTCELDGRIVTSAAHNGRLVTDIDLVIDEATGDVVSMTSDNIIVTRTVAKDAAQTAIIAKWKALIAPIANRVVATIAGDIVKTPNALGESALGNLIADAQLAASSGARVAFMNPGGIRTDLVATQISGGEGTGEVTYGELFNVQPFSNNLVMMDMTGAQIERVLEEPYFDFAKGTPRSFTPPALPPVLQISSSLGYVVDLSRPAGDRIDPSTIEIDGVVVDPNATYRVVGNVFLMDGGDGFAGFKQGTNRVSGVFDLEALETYLAARPGFSAPALGRIQTL